MMNSVTRYIPNLLTGIRLLLIPVLVYLLLIGKFTSALYLIIVMGLTDAFDGFLAKKLNCVSRFGEFFDPICDKFMLISTTITLAYMGLLPVWLVLLIIARDLIIVTGGYTYYLYIKKFRASPSVLSKANTFFQLLLTVIVIYSQINFVPAQWIGGLINIVAVTTILSGTAYVWTWGRSAIRARA